MKDLRDKACIFCKNIDKCKRHNPTKCGRFRWKDELVEDSYERVERDDRNVLGD